MDKAYWDSYYKNSPPTLEPSPFAKYIAERYLSSRRGTLLELGCGNGRDSLYFGKLGFQVTAIDESEFVIHSLNQRDGHSIDFRQGDFVKLQELNLPKYYYIYSRFTLHSITDEQQDIVFRNIWESLEPDGLFMIEARSVQDELCGKGEAAGRNAYIYNNHYRRFLDLEELVTQAKKVGFQIEFADQQKDWASYGRENPIVIRLVLRKALFSSDE